MDRLLLHIKGEVAHAGSYLPLAPKDYPLVFAKSLEECEYLLNVLLEQSYLERGKSRETGGSFRLTALAWKRLRELERSGTSSSQAFIASSFADEMDDAVLNGIKPAIEESGYDMAWVKQIRHNEKICGLIAQEIRRSAFVVADVTEQRQNVYYEAGYAHGLGLPVIWTCKKEEVDDLHFDTRQYFHILWTDAEDLKKQLSGHILATIPGKRREAAPT